MSTIQTPEDRFRELPGYHFQPNYVEIDGLRLHFLDEGDPSSDEIILCLHGEPSWSYLYRKIIPILALEHRVIAMDFIGFGRSDKLTNQADYSFNLHLNTLLHFIEKNDLTRITVIVQDWGGLIGLSAATRMKDRFSRLVIMNTGLPTGETPMPEAFLRWRKFAGRLGARLPVGRIIKGGLAHPELISKEEIAAYEAPFPDERYKAGAAVWPLLVPIEPDDPGAVELQQTRNELANWRKPCLIMFSDADPITRGGDRFFRYLIPSTREQPEIVIHDAGHFLQEEKGEEIAEHVLAFIKRSPHD